MADRVRDSAAAAAATASVERMQWFAVGRRQWRHLRRHCVPDTGRDRPAADRPDAMSTALLRVHKNKKMRETFYWHCSHSTRQGPSVCLFVCLSQLSGAAASAVGLLLWARRAGDIDRLMHGRCPVATAQHAHCSTALSSECEQCHVHSRRRKLNANLLIQLTSKRQHSFGLNSRASVNIAAALRGSYRTTASATVALHAMHGLRRQKSIIISTTLWSR